MYNPSRISELLFYDDIYNNLLTHLLNKIEVGSREISFLDCALIIANFSKSHPSINWKFYKECVINNYIPKEISDHLGVNTFGGLGDYLVGLYLILYTQINIIKFQCLIL